MAKYKVIKEFVFNGFLQKVGAEIELDYQQEKLRSIKSFIEKMVPNPGAVTASSVKPVPDLETPARAVPPIEPPKTMNQYKVLEAFELTPAIEASEGVEVKEAVMAEVDSVVELSDERAAELGEKVEKVA